MTQNLKIWSNSFADLAAIPAEYAFGVHDAQSHVT